MISLRDVFETIGDCEYFSPVIDSEDLSISLKTLVLALVNNADLYLVDNPNVPSIPNAVAHTSVEKLVGLIGQSSSRIHFQTSGTTGSPKKVVTDTKKLLRGVSTGSDLKSKIWGFCYSTRHISGMYMMLQAIMTDSVLVDLRNLNGSALAGLIKEREVDYISAPATFFRLNLPLESPVSCVLKITNGGEPLPEDVVSSVENSFPNAEIRNVYASTEFGSLFSSSNHLFEIPPKLKGKVKILDDTLIVHRDLLADFEGSDVEWYDTKDKVEMHGGNKFAIIGRSKEEVKVLGHLVSFRRIEALLASHPGVRMCRISAKAHKVFGNLLTADVVSGVVDKDELEKTLKAEMKAKLRPYEIPQRVKFVEDIDLTSSGKLKR